MMTSTPLYAILVIAVAAALTLLLRAAPFLLFGGKKEMPKSIKYLGTFLPPAMVATLVIYCIRDTNLLVSPHGLPQILSIALVIALHLWKRNTLLSISGGTILYMILINM